MTCKLHNKQALLGLTYGPIPCERIVLDYDACIHNSNLNNYNPANWKYKIKNIDDIFQSNNYSTIEYCKSCKDKHNLSDFEENTNKYLIFVAFSNKCNLSCRMCNPVQSNNLLIDQKYFIENNLYDRVVDITKDYFTDKYNIYVDDDQYSWIYNNGHKIGGLSVTGGEPFFEKKFIDLLQHYVDTNISKDIKLRIFTNGTLFNNKIINLLNQFNEVYLFVSVDGVDNVYEYIRHRSKFNRLNSSLGNLSKLNNIKELHFVMTLNVINIFNVKDFEEWVNYNFDCKINYVHVYPNTRGISLCNLNEDIISKAVDQSKSFKFKKIMGDVKGLINPNKQKIIEELTLFDVSRDQNFKDIIDDRIFKWLNE